MSGLGRKGAERFRCGKKVGQGSASCGRYGSRPSYHQDLNAVCNLLGRLTKLGDGPLSSVPLGYRRGAWMAGVVFGTRHSGGVAGGAGVLGAKEWQR